MVNATETITLFNTYYDSETRREKLSGTKISGVHVFHSVGISQSGSQGGASQSDNVVYKIRIPVTAEIQDGRAFVNETEYRSLADVSGYWTLQRGCYILLGDASSAGITSVEALQEYDPAFIVVTEYADNTRRGSTAVRHWRIGGA